MRYAAQLLTRPVCDLACKLCLKQRKDHVAPAHHSRVAHQQGSRGGRAALELVRQQRRLLHVGGRPWRQSRCTAPPAALAVQVSGQNNEGPDKRVLAPRLARTLPARQRSLFAERGDAR
ncbi:hypothetical protein MRX96_019538 [Rhipicephalus microplus]